MTRAWYTGLGAGLVLGLLDGLSAALAPVLPPELTVIVVAATVKGLINGAVVVTATRWVDGLRALTGVGALSGLVLSALAAAPSGAYVEIIVPGTVVGLLVGLIVAKWGR